MNYSANRIWLRAIEHVLLTGENEGYYEDFQDATRLLARCLEQGFAYQGEVSPHRGAPRGDGGGRAQEDLEARAKVRSGAQGKRVVCGVAAHPSAQTRRVGSCAARVVMGRISGRERASGGRAW